MTTTANARQKCKQLKTKTSRIPDQPSGFPLIVQPQTLANAVCLEPGLLGDIVISNTSGRMRPVKADKPAKKV